MPEEQLQVETQKIEVKNCTKCKLPKPISDFYKNKSSKDGLHAWCKVCVRNVGIIHNRSTRRPVLESLRKVKKQGFGQLKPTREPRIQPPRVTKDSSAQTKTKALTFYQNCFFNAYEELQKLGLSIPTIRTIFGISRDALQRNTTYEQQGEQTYQIAMAELQANLASHMLIRAIGYSYNEEKIIYVKEKSPETGQMEWVECRKEVWKRHQAGSSDLMTFYMTNRFPKDWKNSKELLTGKVEGYDGTPGQRDRKKIESLSTEVLGTDTKRPETERIVQG